MIKNISNLVQFKTFKEIVKTLPNGLKRYRPKYCVKGKMKHIVYFLFKKNKVVYIGISKDTNGFHNRLSYHRKCKEFDSYSYYEFNTYVHANRANLLELEFRLIREHQPKYNKQHLPSWWIK